MEISLLIFYEKRQSLKYRKTIMVVSEAGATHAPWKKGMIIIP